MALRDQPYLPLYIQDFMTDERLAECSASANGVLIRIMCLMHKSEPYGKILLKQKYKQTDNQILNFATQVAKNLPYTTDEVYAGITELVTEKVLQIEDDFLVQKRMVRDNDVSVKRSQSGRKGGSATQEKVKNFALAKEEANSIANTEYEIESENETEIVFGNKKEHRISIKKVYVGDKVKVIHDLEMYFRSTGQLEILQEAGWTQFQAFMAANPAAVYNDDRHLYNAFKMFSTAPGKGKAERNIDDL